MDYITVKKQELLEKLKSNRALHIAEYKTAMEEYQKDLLKELARLTKQVKNGIEINHTINIVRPASYEDSYNTSIEKLEWHSGDMIDLTDHEFAQWVQNRWNWTSQFASTVSFYNSKKTV